MSAPQAASLQTKFLMSSCALTPPYVEANAQPKMRFRIGLPPALVLSDVRPFFALVSRRMHFRSAANVSAHNSDDRERRRKKPVTSRVPNHNTRAYSGCNRRSSHKRTPQAAPSQRSCCRGRCADDHVEQVSLGAGFFRATIALVMQMILNMLGVGVGLSTVDVASGDTPSAGTLSLGAGIWWVVSGIVAAAVGGYIAGRLPGKPSQSTTAYHGLIAWAVSTIIIVYLISSAASGLIGGTLSTASSVLGGAGKALGGSLETAVQTAAPSLNNVSDPMATIENKVRSASGGQDPSAIRDAAVTAVRAALTGDPAQQAAATDKAADALAKAQNIPVDQAKTQVQQYQQQYKQTVDQAKEQAKQAADTTAKTVSRGALFGAIALLLGALAAFFAGQAAAVTPTVTRDQSFA